ncbi:MAG: periplasmic heavy metal sensor [Desulfovibrio sp.]|nr:periplasmic heavy metal sensor [Desulfovibrio sp.]
MKRNIIALVAVAALVALSAVAFAAPRGGRGAAQTAITPEQRATIQKIIESRQEKLYELREKIWAKHAELQALSNSGKGEKADIQNLVGEISKLRDAMHKERLAIRSEIEKQTGLKGFGPEGYHRGGMGYGMGYNEDCGTGGGMGRGFGSGAGCPGGVCN